MIRQMFLLCLLLSSLVAQSVNAAALFLAKVQSAQVQYSPKDRVVYQLTVMDVLSEEDVPENVELVVERIISADTLETGRVLLVSADEINESDYYVVDVFAPQHEFYWSAKSFRSSFQQLLKNIFETQNDKHSFARQGIVDATVHFENNSQKIAFSNHNTHKDYLIAVQYYLQKLAQKFAPYVEPGTNTTFRILTHEFKTTVTEVVNPMDNISLAQKISGSIK